MENRMDRVSPTVGSEVLLSPESEFSPPSASSQGQLAMPSPKHKKILTPKRTALFGGLALLIILSVSFGVNYLHILPGNEKWSFHARGAITASPAVIGGTVYVGTDPNYPDVNQVDSGYSGYQGVIYALDATSGNAKWSFWMNGTTNASPVVVNGMVYVSTDHSSAGFDQGVLYALNAASGHEEWSYPIGGGSKSFSPTIVNSAVYVVSQHHSVDALNAVSGHKKWSFPLGKQSDIHSSPIVANGIVYAGTAEISLSSGPNTGVLYALNALTGSKKWSYATESEIDVSPLVSNGLVYVPSLHAIHALDVAIGILKWTYLAEGSIYSSPVVSNGLFYVNESFLGMGVSTLYAFNATTGNQKWSHRATVGASVLPTADSDWISQLAATGADWSPPVVVNDVVYVTSNADSINDHLYAFDAVTGRKIWSQQVEGPTPYTLTVVNGTIYMSSLNSVATAFVAASGNEKWSYATKAVIQAAPVEANGLVYVGANDGTLHAIRA